MSPWNRHPSDERLSELARGELEGRARRRAMDHLRGCGRCAERHERLVILERTLAGGRVHEPSAAELAALREANRAAVLTAARAERPAASTRTGMPRWLVPALSVALVGMVGVLTVRQLAPSAYPPGPSPTDPEFTARGNGAPGSAAVLRVFCALPAATPTELTDGQGCPAGATLAFSVRFEVPPEALALEIRGGPRTVRIPLAVQLEAGRETVLPHTEVLEGTGAREVVLTGGTRTLRQTVRIEAAP